MNRPPLRAGWAIALAAAALLWSPCLASEADPFADDRSPEEPAVETPVVEAPPGDNRDEAPLREQSIYIPYEKLRRVFEKEGRGVFLPYDEFQELWKAAREKTAPAVEPKPPVGALITEVENEATVAGDVVRVDAVVKIDLLAEGWQEVPLSLADSAILEAKLGDQPARIVPASSGYKLLVEKKGKEPEPIELRLQYARAITRAPGQNSVSFQAPQAPVSRWRVRIPEAGVKVNISPLLAATEVTAEKAADDPAQPEPEETVVLAFVGAAPTVRIDWTPKAEGATGLEALASVQAEQQVAIEEGVVRTRTQLTYTISRAEMPQLRIEVPADQKVVNVFDANIRQWSVTEADGRQTITVQLFEPAKGTQNLIVELEKFVTQEPKQTALAVPVVKALAVGRQQGVVVVRVAEGLRSEVTRTSGLLQVDAAELPRGLAEGRWAFAYRYAAVPFELVLSTEKVQPRILVDSLVEAELAPEGLTVDLFALYTVERAGIFRLEWELPPGFELRQVRGHGAAGAQAAQVDTHHLEGEGNRRLVVNLGRKALGRVGLSMQLYQDLQQPDLLTPTGKAAEIPLPIPQPAPGSVQRSSGRLVVYAPESLRVNPGKAQGLRSVSFKEALEGMVSARARASSARPVLAFAFTQEPTALALAAERRKPQVTIRQLLIARIEDGVVKYQANFFYDILYSGVKALRIDLPADVASQVRNNTPSIREKIIDPPPADLDEGHVAWSLSGENELLGQGKIELVWEKSIDKLDVGRSIDLTVPRLNPRGVDRAWGQIVLAKAETLDIRESGEPKGLRPIDPQHDLMPGAAIADAAAALEFHGDWSLALTVTRYELEEVKQTSIERAVVRSVVTRADKLSVQALYRMRSARQRLMVKLPPEAALDAEPRIDGRPVALELGENRQYFIPLVDTRPKESFLLELRYTVAGDGTRIEIPEFPVEPAVQKVLLCVYLPQERVLLHTDGPWTEEFRWTLDGFDWVPVSRASEHELLNWVSQGVKLDESFATDGELYVFSALQPAPAPAGALSLSTWDEQALSWAVIGLVLLGGLALLPARAGVRAVAVGGLVIALVFVGVQWPIFARQVLDGRLACAIFVVLVVWIVEAVRRISWGRWTAPAAEAEKRQPPPEPTEALPAAKEPPEAANRAEATPEPASESTLEIAPEVVEEPQPPAPGESPPSPPAPPAEEDQADREEGGRTNG